MTYFTFTFLVKASVGRVVGPELSTLCLADPLPLHTSRAQRVVLPTALPTLPWSAVRAGLMLWDDPSQAKSTNALSPATQQ